MNSDNLTMTFTTNEDLLKILFICKLEKKLLFSLCCTVLIKNLLWYAVFAELMGRVFANGPGGWVSIPGRVIPKTQKMVLVATLLNTQHYKVRIKSKWSNPGNGVVPSPTP